MRTTWTLPTLPAVWTVALLSVAGLQACSSSGGGGGAGAGGGGAGGSSGAGGSGGSGGQPGPDAGGAGGRQDAAPQGGNDGSAGGSGGTGGGADASMGGADGRASDGAMAGPDAPAAAGPPPGAKKLAAHVLTWYTFQDNTPVNSLFSGSGRLLKPFVSVAIPRRELKGSGGTLNYGDKLYLAFLDGRMMPDGSKHSGWVQVDDFCGDAGDDSYCFQQIPEGNFPNVDLYLGDFTKTGMMASPDGDCTGPAGSGQELTDVYTGTPATTFKSDYGGSALGSGKCGDKVAARTEQKGTSAPGESGCWGYDGQDSEGDCSMCTKQTCASR
jgi:hypothetical protein